MVRKYSLVGDRTSNVTLNDLNRVDRRTKSDGQLGPLINGRVSNLIRDQKKKSNGGTNKWTVYR